MTTPEALFERQGQVLVPSEHVIGPWDRSAMHGGPPSALLAAAVQALAPDMQVARLTYEFLGPVPVGAVSVSAQIIKPGRRFQLAEGTLSSGGREVLLVRAVLLRRDVLALPEAARWTDPLPAGPPERSRLVDFPVGGSGESGFHRTGIDLRFAEGSYAPGPTRAWFRLDRDLVAGEPVPAVCRVVCAADFGNGVGSVLDWNAWTFVNCDLTVTLLRDPIGVDVLLDSDTEVDPAGIGWAASRLFDRTGPIGFSQQTLFVTPR